MESACTHRLTDDGVFDAIDATGEHGEGQRRVEAEVQQHVPSLSTDADRAARDTQRWLEGAKQTLSCFVLRHKNSFPLNLWLFGGDRSHQSLYYQSQFFLHALLKSTFFFHFALCRND